MKYNNSQGSALIEVVVGAAILVGVFSTFGGIAHYALRITNDSSLRIRSAFLASEGVEAIKTMRDRTWNGTIVPLTAGTEYYFTFASASGEWQATSTPVTVDGIFTRKIKLENVSRDVLDRITASGGSNDPNTRKATITVTWTGRGGVKTDRMSTYITNIFKN
jgi:hypothetical protein